MAKLNEGVKFDEVARNYSEDKARQGKLPGIGYYYGDCSPISPGGALGWKTKGSLDPKFEEVAFALEPSSTSSPKIAEVKTGFGYHIIMVRRTQASPLPSPWHFANIQSVRRSKGANSHIYTTGTIDCPSWKTFFLFPSTCGWSANGGCGTGAPDLSRFQRACKPRLRLYFYPFTSTPSEHLLLGLEVVEEDRALLRLLTPVLDDDARAVDDLAGVTLTVENACR